MLKPSPGTYPEYFQRYIDQVADNDLFAALGTQNKEMFNFLSSIDEAKSTYAYAPGKWTLKEMLQHIIDAERIFAFRALCFARRDPNSIPGFEEDDYAANSHAGDRSWQDLIDELKIVRQSTELLFKSFSKDDLVHSGLANNKPTTPISLGFILLGHFNHHRKVIEERYL